MIRILLVALTFLAGTGSLLSGQDRTESGRDSDPGPITTLLQLRDELALTPAQITLLTAIDTRMEDQNRPLVSRLSQIHSRIRRLGDRDKRTAEQRAQYDVYVAEARPLMRQIQQNNKDAMEQVGNVLSPNQKDQVARLLKDRNNSDRDRSSRSTRREPARN